MRPAYITAARLAGLRDDRQVVRDQHDARGRARRRAACSSCRICACTITSSAVVGSSASSTRGSQASAIAIAARWRMPPENSCGKRRARSARMPTSSSSSPQRACARAPARDAVQLHRLDDLVADALHRVERVHRALEDHRDVASSGAGAACPRRRARMSSPSSSTRPATLALGGSRPISARLSVVLPQPDSPTRPMRSPRASVEADALHGVQLAAAAEVEPDVQVLRPSSTGARAHASSRAADERAQAEAPHREVADAQARVERVLDRGAEHRQADDDDRDRDAGRHDRPPRADA